MGLRSKRSLRTDDEGVIALSASVVILLVAALGVSIFAYQAGSGVESALTLFGQEIGMYVAIGLTIAALFFLWLVFGRK